MSGVAVVTGGSRGIGAAICREAAARGYDVVIGFRTGKAEADAVASDIAAHGRASVAVEGDLADPSAVDDLAAAARRLGPVALLVNNAGITSSCSLDEVTRDDWNRAVAVNLTAPAWLAKALAGDLRRTRGAVVNVASVGGIVGSLHSLAYGATKAGLLGVTKTLARMLVPDVRVNAVCPGPIATDLLDGITDEQLATILVETPMNRLGTPEEVARVALDVSSWLFCTGQTIVVDGGRVMH